MDAKTLVETASMERSYAVVIKPKERCGYSVTVPALPEAATMGDTIDECLANAREVIALIMFSAHLINRLFFRIAALSMKHIPPKYSSAAPTSASSEDINVEITSNAAPQNSSKAPVFETRK
jgi:predicted RNase H-like HicB family nuclease